MGPLITCGSFGTFLWLVRPWNLEHWGSWENAPWTEPSAIKAHSEFTQSCLAFQILYKHMIRLPASQYEEKKRLRSFENYIMYPSLHRFIASSLIRIYAGSMQRSWGNVQLANGSFLWGLDFHVRKVYYASKITFDVNCYPFHISCIYSILSILSKYFTLI